MTPAIWWIRRDLRLLDNPALQASLESASSIIPVFILDPILIESPKISRSRLSFLYGGLEQLQADLSSCGSRLIIRKGIPTFVLNELFQESGAIGIFAEADYTPYAQKRDKEVGAKLPLVLTGGSSFSHPEVVMKANGTPYTVFTPFMRSWKGIHHPTAANLIHRPKEIPTPMDIISDPIPKLSPSEESQTSFPPGEAIAQQRLKLFTTGEGAPIYQYTDLRNCMDLEGTSQLSPYLHFGMISVRAAFMAANKAISQASDDQSRLGAETWLNELIWREFYISILYHFPHVLRQSFRPDYRRIPWLNNQDEFLTWCRGNTGYPIVDAAMHQLAKTGWMHNRARMITASFLVKDLLIDWRWGERWFLQNLVDGDSAANNGGWQWTAGTGTDAAPYFRIFNPILQGKKYDPDGVYIRRWLPALTNVPNKYIHTPWEMPEGFQSKSNCIIGKHYPPPIIDHAFARQRALEAFKAVK